MLYELPLSMLIQNIYIVIANFWPNLIYNNISLLTFLSSEEINTTDGSIRNMHRWHHCALGGLTAAGSALAFDSINERGRGQKHLRWTRWCWLRCWGWCWTCRWCYRGRRIVCLWTLPCLVSGNDDGTHNCRSASLSHGACTTDVPEINLTQPQKRKLLPSPLPSPASPIPITHATPPTCSHYLLLFFFVCFVKVMCVCVFRIIAVSMCNHCAGIPLPGCTLSRRPLPPGHYTKLT